MLLYFLWSQPVCWPYIQSVCWCSCRACPVCRSVTICEIIVHLLLKIKNNKICSVQVLKKWINIGQDRGKAREVTYSKVKYRVAWDLENLLTKCEVLVCLLHTNICTNKYCKCTLNYSDMFRCQYTIFRQFTVVLAKVMNCWNDKIQYSSVLLW